MKPNRHYYEAAGREVKKEKAWWEYEEWYLPNGILRKTSNCGGEWFRYEVIIGDKCYKVSSETASIILEIVKGT